MAEYMDYNDYDYEYKTKKQKRNANIRFTIAILFLVFVVVWTVTHLPENVRTDFDSVYSSAHKIGEQRVKSRNAFLEFNSEFSLDEKVNIDKEFKNGRFDAIYKLTQISKIDLAQDKIDTFNIGNTFVVVRTYVVERQKDANGNYYDKDKEIIIGTLGFDVLIFKFDTTDGFIIEKPERFSIRYHNKINQLVPTIEKVYVQSESFRLNFYTLSVLVESKDEINEFKTNLTLESGINKSEYDKNFFAKQQFIKSNENRDLLGTIETIGGGQRADTYLSSRLALKTPMNIAEVGIKFDDIVYNKFFSFEIENIKNATYKIKVN